MTDPTTDLVTGPIRAATIPAVVREAGLRFGEVEALVSTDRTWTWADLAVEVDRTARGLLASGLDLGDRVGIWAPNSAEWVIAALGVYCAGGTLVPINTRYRGAEALDILDRSGATFLMTVTDFLGTDYVATLAAAAGGVDAGTERLADLPGLRTTVVLAGPVPPTAIDLATLAQRGAEVDDATAAERAEAVRADDVCNILFTSGTTGRSKGAMLAHGPTLRAYADWSELVGLRTGDRFLILNPLFHSFGLHSGLLACLLAGATMLPEASFDVARLARRLAHDRVTVFPAPPTVYQSLLDHDDPELARLDQSHLRVAITGATTIPVELIRRMHAELAFETVLTGYGLTEATGVATMCRPGDPPEVVALTSGRAVPDVEVVVVDDDGHEVPPGEPGEVWVRGYQLMSGYLDDPVQTARAVDPDGWLHTGDIGVVDDAGNLSVTDRKGDMFIVGGFNAYPAEIERMLSAHPAVHEVAVVGVPDERLGEVGAAFVIAVGSADPTELTPERFIAWSREQMANFKVPRHVFVVEELPRNATGKVLKTQLRADAAELLHAADQA